MTKVHKSYEAMCAAASSCFPTWGQKHLKTNWLKDKSLHIGQTNEGEIICLPVTISTDQHNKPYVMDAITGSFYRPNGTCCTSDTLKLLSHEPKDGLDKKLLSMKSIKALGGA
jgi:hypothetical protein